MRKATALFLLVITAIFAIRPVIAMHYCMGELRSFNLYQQHHEAVPLCAGHEAGHNPEHATSPEAGHDTTAACCQSGPAEAAPPVHQTLATSWDGCCDDTLLEFATDDYRNNTEPLVLRAMPSPAIDGMPLFAHLFKSPVPEIDNNPLFRQSYPPEGLFIKDVDFLAYICIYRI